MKFSKKIRRWYTTYALILGYIALALLALLILFTQLNVPKGLSTDEVSALNTTHSLRQIIDNPINLPFKLMHYILHSFNVTDLYRLRAISAIVGLMTISIFYLLIRSIFSPKTALIASLLALNSSWLLHYSRVAVPDIFIAFAIITIPASALWLQRSKRINWVFLLSAILISMLFYIPSMIIMLPLVLIANFKQYKQATTGIGKGFYAFGLILAALCLLPLVRSLIMNPTNIVDLVGLPVAPRAVELLKSIAIVPLSIFAYSPNNPAYNLSSLPYLDIFSATVAALGLLYALLRPELSKYKRALLLIVPYIFLVGFGSTVSSIALYPFIFLMIALGIDMLNAQWINVFPLNPIAKSAGNALIILAVTFTATYHLNRYFFAWRNAPITKTTYSIQNYQNLLQ